MSTTNAKDIPFCNFDIDVHINNFTALSVVGVGVQDVEPLHSSYGLVPNFKIG